MLLSMTGHGEARDQFAEMSVAVEVRTINSRYFKLHLRGNDSILGLEPRVEGVVRQHVRRGGVTVHLRVDRRPSVDDFRLHRELLEHYYSQISELSRHHAWAKAVSVSDLLQLPGVVMESESNQTFDDEAWERIETTIVSALRRLSAMREREGEAMQRDLEANCELVAKELEQIEARSPQVLEGYRERITERVNRLLAELGASVTPADVTREVALFADRTDISEEIVRLRSHLRQFSEAMGEKESSGRKLDFLTQEMFRESNTIGSKANDLEIGRRVIEIKTAIERVREMVQNVE